MKAAATMLAATLSVGLVFPTHADDAKAAMASGAIRMAASMNELALAAPRMWKLAEPSSALPPSRTSAPPLPVTTACTSATPPISSSNGTP